MTPARTVGGGARSHSPLSRPKSMIRGYSPMTADQKEPAPAPSTPPLESALFFELFESLPRQGPGNRACAEQALSLCRALPAAPAVLDLGCGTGGQTLHLAELTGGTIIAMDSHAPSIERLRAKVAARGLADWVQPLVRDMAQPGLPPASFDLIWSEGAFYNLGLERALTLCRGLLRPGGYLAFTDAVWRKQNPPPEVEAIFGDYPTMGRVEDALAVIDRAGLVRVGHFMMPDKAWWDDFYTPMERRIEQLRLEHGSDPAALRILDQLAEEPALHRRYADYYGYVFFVARRPA